MTTAEHLDRIKARCLANLALSEKRTPGPWEHYQEVMPPSSGYASIFETVRAKNGSNIFRQHHAGTSAYIAACAGAAEAGWRSTIAAIDAFETTRKNNQGGYVGDENARIEAVSTILAAWPEELL